MQTTPKRWVHGHVTSGVNFIRGEALQDNYATRALFFWGLGARVAHPQKESLFLQFDYSFSSCQSFQEISQRQGDSLLRINQLVPSLSFELVKLPKASIRSKAGYIAAFLIDEINNVDEVSSGFRIGLGIESKIFYDQTVHLDLDYDFIKAEGDFYKDYDLWKLSLGIYL